MDLTPFGIWTHALDLLPVAEARERAAELEELGFGALWVPEAVGREAFTNAAVLLAGTARIAVGTGVAVMWARDAMSAAAAHRTLTDAYPERFVLGLGVSHRPAVEGLRGATYERPLQTMRSYLDAMDGAVTMSPAPAADPCRVLAALGPKMLALAADRANGAHTYLVPPEHTAQAREQIGPEPLLVPEQAVVLDADVGEARRIGREHLAIYLGLPNYAKNLRRLGFEDHDLADGGSDRLVDAIVAHGDVEAIRTRLREHLDAGADHVCVQVLAGDMRRVPVEGWRELAPALVA